MLRRVAAFELRYQLANPILWITAGAVSLAAFAATGSGFLAEDQSVHHNSPFEVISLYVMFSALFMFVTTAFVADVVLRDDQTGFGPILRSTRIGKGDYLIGRFIGAFAAAALCLALLPPASDRTGSPTIFSASSFWRCPTCWSLPLSSSRWRRSAGR
jgi:ABC-2 type transport system permease protein